MCYLCWWYLYWRLHAFYYSNKDHRKKQITKGNQYATKSQAGDTAGKTTQAQHQQQSEKRKRIHKEAMKSKEKQHKHRKAGKATRATRGRNKKTKQLPTNTPPFGK